MQKLLDKRDAQRKDELWDAIIKSNKTYEDILQYVVEGFDVDKDDVAQTKVAKTLERLPGIADLVRQREKRTDVVRGACAWLKTYVLRPLFNRFLMTDKYFHVDSRLCTHCKRCVKGCPLGNMAADEKGNIIWKHENCTGCLRCYHRCPNKAVQFGRFTRDKGQKRPVDL